MNKGIIVGVIIIIIIGIAAVVALGGNMETTQISETSETETVDISETVDTETVDTSETKTGKEITLNLEDSIALSEQ